MKCYFCQRELLFEDGVDRHHVIPRRYYKNRKTDPNEPSNVVKCHRECHVRFHREYDVGYKLSLDHFVAHMSKFAFGKGIYAGVLAETG